MPGFLPGAAMEVGRARRRTLPGCMRIIEVEVCGAEDLENTPSSLIETIKSPPDEKVVWFLRHGQSTANVAGSRARSMPGHALEDTSGNKEVADESRRTKAQYSSLCFSRLRSLYKTSVWETAPSERIQRLRSGKLADKTWLNETGRSHQFLQCFLASISGAHLVDINFEIMDCAEYRDAQITDIGHEQASALKDITPDWRADLVVVSPLTRALQTACLAFQNTDTEMVVNPCVTESWPDCQENMGRAADEIRDDANLLALKRFRNIKWDDSVLDGEWWRIGKDPERCQAFLNFLSQTPHRRIAVVCHWGFINQLFALCGHDVSLRNCQWARTVLKP